MIFRCASRFSPAAHHHDGCGDSCVSANRGPAVCSLMLDIRILKQLLPHTCFDPADYGKTDDWCAMETGCRTTNRYGDFTGL